MNPVCQQVLVAKGETIFSLERGGAGWSILEYDPLLAKVISRIELPREQCEPRSFAIGDFNLDTKVDFAVTCNETRYFTTRVYVLTATQNNWVFTPIAGAPYNRFVKTKFDAINAIDMDGDGDLDLLTDEETASKIGQGVLWYENPLR